MEKELIDRLIKIAEDIKVIYEKIYVLEVRNNKEKVNKLKNDLKFVLDYEKSLYNQIKLNDFDKYFDYFEKTYPKTYLDLTGILFSSINFSPLHRVYYRLCYLNDLRYINNEHSLKNFDVSCSYANILDNSIFASLFSILNYYPINFSYIKYNIVYSYYNAYLISEKYQSIYPLEPTNLKLKFNNLNKKEYDLKKDYDIAQVLNNILNDIDKYNENDFQNYDTFQLNNLIIVIRTFSLVLSPNLVPNVKKRISESINSVPHIIKTAYEYLLNQLENDQIIKKDYIREIKR